MSRYRYYPYLRYRYYIYNAISILCDNRYRYLNAISILMRYRYRTMMRYRYNATPIYWCDISISKHIDIDIATWLKEGNKSVVVVSVTTVRGFPRTVRYGTGNPVLPEPARPEGKNSPNSPYRPAPKEKIPRTPRTGPPRRKNSPNSPYRTKMPEPCIL